MQTMFKKRPVTLLMASLMLGGCASNRQFTRGTYEDPTVIEMLSDDFNENDLQLIAKKMVNSLNESSLVASFSERKPRIQVGWIENRTSEHIDTESLSDKIRVQLINGGKFTFINVKAREQLAEEYQYQGSGYVRQDEAKGPGAQRSADYMLTGRLTSIVQQVGRDKLVYYKVTFELTDIAEGTITWTDEKELRKKFRKRAVSM